MAGIADVRLYVQRYSHAVTVGRGYQQLQTALLAAGFSVSSERILVQCALKLLVNFSLWRTEILCCAQLVEERLEFWENWPRHNLVGAH